jgi:hypothetical protein
MDMEQLDRENRAIARDTRILLEKIEAMKNPIKKAFAIKLFIDILDILAKP